MTEVKAMEPDRRLAMEEAPARGVIIFQVAPTAGGAIATIQVRDDSMVPAPVFTLARKQQAQENLSHLASVVARKHTRPEAQRSRWARSRP